MTPEERMEAVEYRRLREHPLHSPPHLQFLGHRQFFITGTCYEHQHHIGRTTQRMTDFEADLLAACEKFAASTYAWCVLPNHYYVMVKTADIEPLRHELGQLHGRSSYLWNGEEKQRGRQVWFNCFDRVIKSHRHFWGERQLHTQQPNSASLCRPLAGLAMVECSPIPRTGRPRTCPANLAGVSDY